VTGDKQIMIYIVTHNDLDGVASAAIYLSLARRVFSNNNVEIHFVEPSGLLNLLQKSMKIDDNSIVAFMDLGMNESILPELSHYLSSLSKRNIRIEWYDHHVWSEKWIEALSTIGVAVFIDKSTCGAGVVYRYSFPGVEREECHPMLVEAVCGADLWLWDNPISPLLYRATRMPRGKKGDSFRRYLVEEFSKCRLLNDELINKAEANLDAELSGYKKILRETQIINVCNEKIGILYKELDHPGISLSANYLLGKLELDLAVVVKPDGSVSFRSRKGIARKYALCFGGGGHPNASGGRADLSLIQKFLMLVPFLKKRVLLGYVKKKLTSCC